MNHVPVIVRNPAYVKKLEPDEEVDQADVTPLTSGDSPIITVPALEDKNVVEGTSEDDEEDVPHILRKAIQNRIEPGVKEYIVPRGHKLSTAYCCPQC